MHADQQKRVDQQGDRSSESGRHSAPEGADRHPLIDLDRDPTPGVPDHAKPEDGS